jgi:hypothetical protein
MAVLPVDDGGFEEAGGLAGALALALGDDEALVLGVADVLPAGEATTACVGAWLALVQVGFGVGWIVFSPVAPDVGLVLGLGLGLGDTVGVGVPPGLSLGLTVALGLLVLGLGEALALGLVVLPLLWLPLDDAAGAVAFLVGLLAELAAVSASDGCADGDGHELGVVWTVRP